MRFLFLKVLQTDGSQINVLKKHLYTFGLCCCFFGTIGSDQIVNSRNRIKKIPTKNVRVQVNVIIDYYIAFSLSLACYFQAEKYKNNDMHVKISCNLSPVAYFCDNFFLSFFKFILLVWIYIRNAPKCIRSFFNFLINTERVETFQ